jgi:hypothetical protein
MINKENLETTGRLNITVIDGNGNIKNSINLRNLVVTTGRDWLANRVISDDPSFMSHMEIGSGGLDSSANPITPLLTETTLVTAVTRVAMGSGPSVNENTVTFSAAFPATNNSTSRSISEAGIFNNQTAGIMLCRTTFEVLNIQPADSISITWTITIS